MEGVDTKAQSQGQDSQITSENVEGFQQRVKEIFNLVTELSGIHGALAEQHEHSIKEVKTEHADSSMSINKDTLKVEEKKAIHDPEVLLEKISTLEEEVLTSKKKIQDLTDKNEALLNKISTLEKEVTGLNLVISKANRRIKTMENVIEGSRKQLTTRDELNKKQQQELSYKVFNLNQEIHTLWRQFDEVEAQKLELHDEIAKKDEEIMELNSEIDQLKLSHAAEEGTLNAEIESLHKELEEKCKLVDELNRTQDTLMELALGKKIGP